MGERLIQIAAALTFVVILATLAACDGDVDRKQRIAEFNQSFVNACLPEVNEPMLVRWERGEIICYPAGKKRQPRIVSNVGF